MKKFEKLELKKLYKPATNSVGEDNGQVTIIGGSSLFHGSPLFSLRVASRVVDMVFFSSPEPTLKDVTAYLKADLSAFIWVPWTDVEEYVAKSDAILIGPGFMRYHKKPGESDEAYKFSKKTTEDLLSKYPSKRWVIDAGSLQTMDPKFIPVNSVLTPNSHEYEILFGKMDPKEAASKYKCVIVIKGPVTTVYSADEEFEVHGGNPGLTKGGTGDVQAGLTVSFLAKNEPMLAACAASLITKAAGEFLEKKVGLTYNADDLADAIPLVIPQLLKG